MPHNIRTPLLDLVSDLRGDLGKFAVEGCPFGLKFGGGEQEAAEGPPHPTYVGGGWVLLSARAGKLGLKYYVIIA